MDDPTKSDEHPTPGAKSVSVVLGVIGNDPHVIGNQIISYALESEGLDVVNLGVMVPAEDFVAAAIESDARAILVSSLSGFGEVFCRGFRERCVEAGLDDILLYVGGNIVMGRIDWSETKQIFEEMGFDRVYPPHSRPEEFIADLKADLGIDETAAVPAVPED